MEKAYMIRNDGKAIPVTQHLYGNMDEVTETLFAGEWLYNNTNNSETKKAFINLVACYARFYEGLEDAQTLISDLCDVIGTYPYVYLTAGFVQAHSGEIEAAFDACASGGRSDIQVYSREVINELNQEFLRARYGGLYNTDKSSREMVFRVSSSGFNWYDIIWTFVYENKNLISSVTIVRDEESTGMSNEFYRAKDGSLYNQMPVDDFLTESGNPVIETSDPVRKLRLTGAPLSEMKNLPMNADRIKYRYNCIVQQENRLRTFWF